MLSTTLFTIAVVLGMSSAAPLKARYDPAVEIIFNGAAGASYTVEVPLDGSVTATSTFSLFSSRYLLFLSIATNSLIDNVLSISSIEAPIDVDSLCTLVTVDSPPPVLVEGPSGTWVVGPPQTITSISCSSGSTPPPPPPSSITIEFDGADPTLGAEYTLSVPLDGTLTYTSKSFVSFNLRPMKANI